MGTGYRGWSAAKAAAGGMEELAQTVRVGL